MNERSFDEICAKIKAEVYNRKKGSFLRALWYGGRTEGFRGIPNGIVGHFGKGKGLRKAIRNAPRAIVASTVGIAVGAPIVVFGTPAALPAAALAGELAKQATKLAFDAVMGITQDLAMVIVDSIEESISYSYIPGEESNYRKMWPRKKPVTESESLRKTIKHEIKDLKKGMGMRIVDRNLVKLKDAQQRIASSIEHLEELNTASISSGEELYEATFSALRNVAETVYYTKKIKGLLADIQAPLGKLSVNSLKPFRDHVRKVDNDLKNYIKMVIEQSHSMGGGSI